MTAHRTSRSALNYQARGVDPCINRGRADPERQPSHLKSNSAMVTTWARDCCHFVTSRSGLSGARPDGIIIAMALLVYWTVHMVSQYLTVKQNKTNHHQLQARRQDVVVSMHIYAVLKVLLHGRRTAATLLHHVPAFPVPGLMALTSRWLYHYIEPYTWYHH